jgi:alpha-glucan,water dikinase
MSEANVLKSPVAPQQALRAALAGASELDASTVLSAFVLEGGGELAAAVRTQDKCALVTLVCTAESPLVLHWGLAWRYEREWILPDATYIPPNSTSFEGKAIRTNFEDRNGLSWLHLRFEPRSTGLAPRGLSFVLWQPQHQKWLKVVGGKEFYLPLAALSNVPAGSAPWQHLAGEIIAAEMGKNSWTLMHRFNLCYDLIRTVEKDPEALALLFVWLRYSAIRQLDWQRNYNTKPSELSAAENRLTNCVAGIWKRQRPARPWMRLLLSTLGRGGEGQQVRDEILYIMHRNDIKEIHGQFLEEWHQKLHNNTTPDDVVICQAYLAFMRSRGDLNAYYRTLKENGVKLERLRGFDRPIRADPQFWPDRNDALIGDFERFLRILQSVHSGTDFNTAAAVLRGRVDQTLTNDLDHVLYLSEKRLGTRPFAAAVLAARRTVARLTEAAPGDPGRRDLLFLDLALEELFRRTLEGQSISRLDRDEAAAQLGLALQNLALSVEDEELSVCTCQWETLAVSSRENSEWILQAKSVVERIGRIIVRLVTQIYERLQPQADFLGAACGVEKWTAQLFTAEIIRGGSLFIVDILLRQLDTLLRVAAGLGGWRVISAANATGRIAVASSLAATQERFGQPAILLADSISGNEDIPEGVRALISLDSIDLVSHIAVRARNAGVLLATCFELPVFEHLKQLQGKILELHTTLAGAVDFREIAGDAETAKPGTVPSSGLHLMRRVFQKWAVTAREFTPELVGEKSLNLEKLRGRLPEWVRLLAACAVPFGVFEETLASGCNKAVRAEYETARVGLEQQAPEKTLPGLSAAILRLAAPEEFKASLLEVSARAGLELGDWDAAWMAIKYVWASKWNKRAFLSRRLLGIPHDDLTMAVLIQAVVNAEYAFVIHTVHPLTGNRDELYGEVVPGLGEAIVNNFPGQALGFTCSKTSEALRVSSYPSKSVGIYGQGIIFRSDSNGEDLEDFAGAGLYDSFLAQHTLARLLDYAKDPLVCDAGFRERMLRQVARIGIEVERRCGLPQDIEGAYSGGAYYLLQTRPQVGLH